MGLNARRAGPPAPPARAGTPPPPRYGPVWVGAVPARPRKRSGGGGEVGAGGVHCHAAPRRSGPIRPRPRRAGVVMTEQERHTADVSDQVPEPRNPDDGTT